MSEQGHPDSSSQGPWTTPNGIYHDYDLHCHCGAIRLTMKISPPLYEEHAQGRERCVATEGDCSYCERNGYHSVHPLAKDVTWTRGYEGRGEYLLGSKKNPQIFCKTCASVIATDISALMTMRNMEPRYTINVSDCTKERQCMLTRQVRMLKNYDPKKVKVRRVEFMKDMPPKYELED